MAVAWQCLECGECEPESESAKFVSQIGTDNPTRTWTRQKVRFDLDCVCLIYSLSRLRVYNVNISVTI